MNELAKPQVLAWAIYDWANSAFSTIVSTFIFGAYFIQSIAVNEIVGTQQWGYAIAIAGIIIAICSPVFGAIADHSGHRKIWLGTFSCLAIIGSVALWYAKPDSAYIYYTLACVILGTLGLEIAGVFYNAMLPSITTPEYFGRVSGWAWSFGYAGGLVSLTIALYAFVQGQPAWLDTQSAEHIRICGPFVALWFILFAWPLFITFHDKPVKKQSLLTIIQNSFADLRDTFTHVRQEKNVFLFLLARMIYIDGLNTIFAFGGIYAAGTFGLSLEQVVEFGILLNVTAGLGAASFGWIDDWIGAKRTILIALTGLTILGTSLVFVTSTFWFVVLAATLSTFVGPTQAASRSLLARLAPKKRINEYFGLYAFSGKITSFIGPWLLGFMTVHYASQRMGIAAIMLFFVIGGALLTQVKE